MKSSNMFWWDWNTLLGGDTESGMWVNGGVKKQNVGVLDPCVTPQYEMGSFLQVLISPEGHQPDSNSRHDASKLDQVMLQYLHALVLLLTKLQILITFPKCLQPDSNSHHDASKLDQVMLQLKIMPCFKTLSRSGGADILVVITGLIGLVLVLYRLGVQFQPSST